MTGRIYLIRNMVNGKAYIGQTTRSVKERMREHISDARLKRTRMSLHLAIAKYGEDKFSVIELASAEEGEILNDLEKYYIKTLRTLTCQNGYNISPGGKGRESGFSVSLEAREKMSKARKGKPAWNKGKPQSEAQKLAHSERMKGRSLSAEARRKIGEKSKGNKYRLGKLCSVEHKAKVSASLLGNKRSVGRVVSEETRTKMTNSRKGVALYAMRRPWTAARRAAQTEKQLKRFESEIIQ